MSTWWKDEGARQLNKILVGAKELCPKRLKGIGIVPLENLIEVPESVDLKDLAHDIQMEGIPTVYKNEGIFIKI
jgi:hypothetical protein